MWKSSVEILKSKHIQKISILYHDRRLTYSEVRELWRENKAFNSFFSSLLAESPFLAYFWETPPITISNIHQAFEFVLVDSPRLAQVQPNSNPFRQYFQSVSLEEEIISFPNLRKDALLVVPCPIAEESAYPHLASFVREAPESQQQKLWQCLGQVIQQNINHQPMWVSTSGLGVYWLHIRLDSYPKYYTYKPYKGDFSQRN